MIVMLDTNAYSGWRRSGMWHETLVVAEKIYVPAIVVGELDFWRTSDGLEPCSYRDIDGLCVG